MRGQAIGRVRGRYRGAEQAFEKDAG
jgi:hypothetical protein